MLLTPIYAAVGITCPEKQVVRSLLASMPPSMDIPVHHDTGFWVKHTHRCHVPIITNEKVDFLVGPTADRMVKVPFREGCLLELNNQAKHAVTNGNARESGFWRVHLIFDYVDLPATVAQETTTATTAGTTVDAPVPMSATTGEDGGAVLPSPPCTSAGTSAATAPPVFTRTVLQPGDVVHQTRRSIAVAGAPPAHTGPLLPLFMIIGAQKSGTTSMYDYITQHPLVLKGQRREAHYFDWRYRMDLEDQTLTVAGMKQSVEQHRSHYMSTFYHPGVLKVHTSLITGDSTPSYLLHSDVVIPRLLRMYGAGKTVTTTRIVASAAATTPTSSSSDSGGGTATTSTDSSTTTVAVNTTELEAPLKLLVMMRDPVDRAYSQFQMMRDQQGTAEQMRNRGKSALSPTLSFAEVVDLELEAIEAAGGLDAESSLEHFRTAHLSKISHFTHGGHSLILRGVYYFQLLSWMQYFPLYTGKQHSSGEVSSSSHCGSGSSGSAGSGDPLDRAEILVTTLDEISMDKHAAPTREGAARIQNKMNEVFAFLGLREHGLEDVSIKNKRLYKTEEPSSSSSSGSSSSSVEKKAVDQDKDQDKANKSPSMLPEVSCILIVRIMFLVLCAVWRPPLLMWSD